MGCSQSHHLTHSPSISSPAQIRAQSEPVQPSQSSSAAASEVRCTLATDSIDRSSPVRDLLRDPKRSAVPLQGSSSRREACGRARGAMLVAGVFHRPGAGGPEHRGYVRVLEGRCGDTRRRLPATTAPARAASAPGGVASMPSIRIILVDRPRETSCKSLRPRFPYSYASRSNSGSGLKGAPVVHRVR